MNLSIKLRQICTMAGSDYGDLLRYIGETPVSIRLIETRSRRPSQEMVRKLDELFGTEYHKVTALIGKGRRKSHVNRK